MMAVSGTKGAFGWVAQVAQDDLPASGEFNTDGMTWHKVLTLSLIHISEPTRPY